MATHAVFYTAVMAVFYPALPPAFFLRYRCPVADSAPCSVRHSCSASRSRSPDPVPAFHVKSGSSSFNVSTTLPVLRSGHPLERLHFAVFFKKYFIFIFIFFHYILLPCKMLLFSCFCMGCCNLLCNDSSPHIRSPPSIILLRSTLIFFCSHTLLFFCRQARQLASAFLRCSMEIGLAI